MEIKKCLVCLKRFKAKLKKANKFCSLKCYWKDKKGKPRKSPSEETRKKISESKKGKHCSPKTEFKRNENHPNWKGNNVKYVALHNWVESNNGKAKNYQCKFCNRQAVDWANIDHKYRRNLDDFIALCRFCHREYDKHNYRSPN